MTASEEGIARLEGALARSREYSERALKDLHQAMAADLAEARRRARRAERRLERVRKRARAAERELAGLRAQRVGVVARLARLSRRRG